MDELLHSTLTLHWIALCFWFTLTLLHLLVLRKRHTAREALRRFRLMQPLMVMALFMLFFTGTILQTFSAFSLNFFVMALLFGAMITVEIVRFRHFKGLEPSSETAFIAFKQWSQKLTLIIAVAAVSTLGIVLL